MPAQFQTVDRIIGDPSPAIYAANTNVPIKLLPGSQVLEYLKVRLSGTLTHAGYTTAPTKLAEAVENLIALIRVQATGKGRGSTTETLKETDMAFNRFQNRIVEGTDVDRTDIGTANQAYAFNSNAKLYFADPRSEVGKLSELDGRQLSALTVNLLFRDATAMVTGGVAGTSTLSSVIAVLHARETLGKPLFKRPFFAEKQIPFDFTATKLGNPFVGLPVGNVLRRLTFKGMVGANNYSDPSDTAFANTTPAEGAHVALQVNKSFKPLDMTYAALRADNKDLFGVESIPAGYAVWEPSRSGRVSDMYSLRGLDRFDALVDTNFTGASTNTIQVTTNELVIR